MTRQEFKEKYPDPMSGQFVAACIIFQTCGLCEKKIREHGEYYYKFYYYDNIAGGLRKILCEECYEELKKEYDV